MAGNEGPPTNAIQAARRSIQELGSDPEAARPVEIYGAGLNDLVKGDGVAALRSVGWRWLVPGEESWTAVDVYLESNGDSLGQPQLLEGAVVDDLARILDEYESAAPADKRVVEIPELNFASVWLANATQSGGTHITLSPVATYDRHTRFDSDALSSLLADMARYQISVDVNRRSPGVGSLKQVSRVTLTQVLAMLARRAKRVWDDLNQERPGPGPTVGSSGGAATSR